MTGLLILVLLSTTPARAELRGHGGPVRALAAFADGRGAVSGSFDQSAILWSLPGGEARQVLRFHEGAVNAVAALADGRVLTGGEDGRIALWRPGETAPAQVIGGHEGPVVALAVSPDGTAVASASWDSTVRVTPLAGGEARVLRGHNGNVNGVAFFPDGRLASAGYDGTLRIWPAAGETPAVLTLPTPLNGIAVLPDGGLAVGGADGTLRLIKPDGSERVTLEIGPTPVIALALSPDGTRLAAATIGGGVAVIEAGSGRRLFELVGPGLPVWSLAFRPGEPELLTGGSDRLVRRWSLRSGEPLGPLAMTRPADELAAFAGDRGAEIFRACVACHTLTPDAGNRAGPTLHGLFGRRIATAPGYNFSPALKALDIVWTPETVKRLFEIGPAAYTPGTKMPEQTVNDPADREALVRFLERVTKER